MPSRLARGPRRPRQLLQFVACVNGQQLQLTEAFHRAPAFRRHHFEHVLHYLKNMAEREGRRPTVAFVNPAYLKRCGVEGNAMIDGLRIVTDVNVGGERMHLTDWSNQANAPSLRELFAEGPPGWR